MPGNSRNASKRTTAKKGASGGTGGKNRASLKGRGKTLPADERPWHKGYSGTEKLPEKTARKQDKERRAAAAEGRAPKIGLPGSKDTTWGRGAQRGTTGRPAAPQRGGSKFPGRGGPPLLVLLAGGLLGQLLGAGVALVPGPLVGRQGLAPAPERVPVLATGAGGRALLGHDPLAHVAGVTRHQCSPTVQRGPAGVSST